MNQRPNALEYIDALKSQIMESHAYLGRLKRAHSRYSAGTQQIKITHTEKLIGESDSTHFGHQPMINTYPNTKTTTSLVLALKCNIIALVKT